MSVQVTTAHVEQYKSSVYHLVQQKGSKVRKSVMIENVRGKNAFIDQVGSTAAQIRTSRHGDSPIMNTPHARRRLSLADYEWGDMVDRQDVIRMLTDPSSKYVEAANWAMGRSIDDVILDAITATAYTGVDGSTSTTFDTNMVVDVQTVWPGVSAADTGLNLAKLIEARKLLGQNDVDPEEEVFVPVNQTQISSLLKDERVISGDYNKALPLMDGYVSRVGGCTLIPCNRINTDANSDEIVPFYTRTGIALGIGEDVVSRATERADKGYNYYIYLCMSIGATRLEEKRVGYIECDPGGSPTTDA